MKIFFDIVNIMMSGKVSKMNLTKVLLKMTLSVDIQQVFSKFFFFFPKSNNKYSFPGETKRPQL